MPFKTFVPETYASREEPGNTRLEDVVYHFHATDQADSSPHKRKRIEPMAPPTRISNLTLALRPRFPTPEAAVEDSASEDEGFQLVKRRASSDVGGFNPFLDCVVLPDILSIEAVSSDDESDTDTVVEVTQSGPSVNNAAHALPIRARDGPGNAATAASDSDSDSDWNLL